MCLCGGPTACTRSWEPAVRAHDRLIDVSRTAPGSSSGIIRRAQVHDQTHLFEQYQIDLEIEARHTLWDQPGKLKLLGFLSHGRMGRYSDATALALQTGMPADIAAVRSAHTRGGVSLNLEQPLTEGLGVFVKAGWSQGAFEAFEFTDLLD